MRRRVDLAVSLVGRPSVLFLDEPTTGLDPVSRFEMWDVTRELLADGTTVLLTTQYLEEADELADRIVVIDKGAVIAEGTADELKDRTGGRTLEVTLRHAADVDAALTAIAPSGGVDAVRVDRDLHQLSVPVEQDTARAAGIVAQLTDAGIEIDDFSLQRPSLDDVFVALTGHAADGDADIDVDRSTGRRSRGPLPGGTDELLDTEDRPQR
jgi:ABC-2 type transport system ATP-binding protein